MATPHPTSDPPGPTPTSRECREPTPPTATPPPPAPPGDQEQVAASSIAKLAEIAEAAAPLLSVKQNAKRRAAFDTLSSVANLSPALRSRAEHLLSLIPTSPTDDWQGVWALCAIYAVAGKRFAQLGGVGAPAATPPTPTPLPPLLRAAKVPLAGLFDPLKTFVEITRLGEQYEHQRQLMLKSYVVSTIMYEKLCRILQPQLVRPTWYLYCLAKTEILTDPPELLPAFSVLLCCVSRATSSALPPDAFGRSGELCQEELAQVHSTLFLPFFLKLLQERVVVGTLDSPQSVTGMSKTYEGLIELTGAFDERLFVDGRDIIGSMSVLPQQSQAYWGTAQRNAAAQLTSPGPPTQAPNSPPSPKMPGAAPCTPGSGKRRAALLSPAVKMRPGQLGQPSVLQRPGAQPAQTPSQLQQQQPIQLLSQQPKTSAEQVPPSTPMHATFATLTWLGALSASAEVPSPAFVHWLDQRGLPGQGGFVAAAVSSIMTNVDLSELSVDDRHPSIVAFGPRESRQVVSFRLLFKFLESLLLYEESVAPCSGPEAYRTLLLNEEFLRALLAVSVEVVAFANKVVTMTFPKSMAIFGVSPLDYFKITDNVLIACEHALPFDIMQHLTLLEEQLLDSLGWQSGSKVETILDAEDPTVSAARIRLIAGSLVASPLSQQQKSALAQQPPQVRPQPQDRSRSLEVFLRKFMYLAARRLQEYGNDAEQMQLYEMWDVFVEIVADRQHRKTLLTNHHLDQVLVCVVHAVHKAHEDTSVTFKALTQKRQVPRETFKVVPLEQQGSVVGDLIAYYNKVFVRSMESFVLNVKQFYETFAVQMQQQQQRLQGLATPGRYGVVRFKSGAKFSPKVASTPLHSRMPLLSPAVFRVAASPGKDLRAINSVVAASRVCPSASPTGRCPAKRLNFDEVASKRTATDSTATTTTTTTTNTTTFTSSSAAPAGVMPSEYPSSKQHGPGDPIGPATKRRHVA